MQMKQDCFGSDSTLGILPRKTPGRLILDQKCKLDFSATARKVLILGNMVQLNSYAGYGLLIPDCAPSARRRAMHRSIIAGRCSTAHPKRRAREVSESYRFDTDSEFSPLD
jgi:hypothetical protein